MSRKYRLIREYRWKSFQCEELESMYQVQYSYFKLLWTDIGPRWKTEERADQYVKDMIKYSKWIKYYD